VGFLNLENFTSRFFKNPKISLVFLIGPFLIRTECVYLSYFDLNYVFPGHNDSVE
jgi:hypothetical protein